MLLMGYLKLDKFEDALLILKKMFDVTVELRNKN